MARVFQSQVRCAGCHRRLADLVNEIDGGQLLLELKCPRCGHSHLEVMRPRPDSNRITPPLRPPGVTGDGGSGR
jgi:phage FluMu protein Com